jgi:peptide/nickel transport system ATP-binding protein
MANSILKVKDLCKYFKTPKGMLHAVDKVSLSVESGKTLGIVGESGCGKSTLGRTILKLTEPTSGQIVFDGDDITRLSARDMRPYRKRMQIIFQDPYSSIDPRKSVYQTISEPLIANKLVSKGDEVNRRVHELMEMVGLADRLVTAFPHELDGGRRQRIGIARALAVNPDFIVCDEPVSALDVSIQAQILNLLKELQRKLQLTYIFITHNLSVVSYFANDIAVMYLGRVVEMAPVRDIFENPIHPYTRALLSAIPLPMVGGSRREQIILKGEITSPVNLPNECRFAKRCFFADERCLQSEPVLIEEKQGHHVACFKSKQLVNDG